MNLPSDLMQGSLLHFENGVPIDDLNLRTEQRQRLARVEHVYWLWMRNPFLDVFPMFKQLVKDRMADAASVYHAAQRDKMLFDYIVEHISGPSRKVAEARVRMVANKLMQNGMATDNGRDMAEGAKIAMKLDRLDQPESEQADMTKVMFLPPVVTTVVSDVDDTKEDVSDEQALAIINKYGAFVDPKRTMIEEKVQLMEANSEAERMMKEEE